ncbi:MAG: glycosyltransferase family 2 protein [Glaciihabitans sp.]|nr:glycosyltransferase family 2 protein [Glaciihabitans sp.]
MQPRVLAILVARNGESFLPRTLAALDSQTRKPDSLVFVDAGSSDATSALLAAAGPTHLVASSARGGFGGGIAQASRVALAATQPDEWLWLLTHDSAPDPEALARLLGAVEVAPSVAVAGPKLMLWDRPDTIAAYGETMTRLGKSVQLVEGELDQAQHDQDSDLLAVASSGMLVRRSVWDDLGGFDPGLPSVDASLDFCVRARLAGHRVVGVPAARVATAGGPELFGRKTVSAGASARLHRAAQLHRRLVYSPGGLALLVHWLSLVPLALFRSMGQLVRKRPGLIGGEFRTAFATAFGGGIGSARRNLRATRKMGWAVIAPLRISARDARELGSRRGDAIELEEAASPGGPRLGFFSDGGGWVVAIAVAISALAFGPLVGAGALTGGGLVPLSATIGELWSHVGWGWHAAGGGFVGASDPFAWVLAVLGSFTFWSPSLSIVILYLVAIPLAATGAWFCAARLSGRALGPAVAALVWALAPPFLSDLTTGHLGAAIAHILLPWLVLATLAAARSITAGAGAALLFAVVAASSPILVPALVVALVAWMAARPTSIHRLIGIVVPAAVLFAPLVVQQVARGNVLGWLADPGVPVASSAPGGWLLALGSPDASLAGWAAHPFGIDSLPAPLIFGILLAPFAIVAVAGLFVPGTRRAIPSLFLALLGFVTAVASTHLALTIVDAQPVTIWPGSGLSLFWLGLTGCLVVGMDSIRRAVVLPALVVGIASLLAVAPLLTASLAGTSAVVAGGRLLPAFVAAQATTRPTIGTIILTAQPDGGLSASLQRGEGTMLDEYAALASTDTSMPADRRELATLAGNLASRSGLDFAAELGKLNVRFVLLAAPAAGGAAPASDASGNEADARQRTADALDGNRVLSAIGDTSRGLLWHYAGATTAGPSEAPTTTGSPLGIGILAGTGLVFLVTVLLAIPAARRRGRSTRVDPVGDAPGFDEDDSV